MATSNYDPKVIAAFNQAIRDTRAGPKAAKALLEAGIVESHLQNLNYGDRDSKGALQQRPSQGWQHATDPYAAAVDFLKQAEPLAGRYGSSGALAQAVQRSAFPGRYAQQAGAASALLGGSAAGSSPQYRSVTTTTPGVDNSQARKLAVLDFLQQGGVKNPAATTQLASTYASLADVPAQTSTKLVKVSTKGNPTGNPQVDGLVDQLKGEAQLINDAKVPYKWGGGHQAKQVSPNAKVVPLDCSGAVSRALGVDPRVASQFKSWGAAGQGKRVTVWASDQHVFLEVDGHYFGTSATNPGGGAGWIPRSAIPASYLKNFTPRHPPGA